MNIVVFFIGFFVGALFVFIPFKVIRNNEKQTHQNTLEQMKLYFENTANKIFQENSNKFSSQTNEKLEDYFKRFRDKIEYFEKRNEENIKLEAEKLTRFDENMKTILEAGTRISKDTSNLVNIMKSDNRTQGHWGEVVLEKVLEASGLRADEEYKIQKGISEGRPDATIYLPQDRCIFIDAKTSISSWDKFVNAETQEEKELAMKEFITSTKTHITNLAKRDYSSNEKSPDYVLMFVPIEGCYSLMFCENCELWDFAWKNKVMPVSPSTLLAALKTINAFHLVDKQNKNAIEISRLCSGMIDKFSSLLNDILKARASLDNGLVKLQGKGNILTQIDKIQNLGISVSKEIPELPNDVQIQEKLKQI